MNQSSQIELTRSPLGRNSRCRRGLSSMELIVSTSVMMAIIFVVAKMSFQIQGVWRDVDHHRVAICELSNHLDRLTRLTPDDAKIALQELTVSEPCARTLSNARLSGQLTKDELGFRVDLKLSWQTKYPSKPTKLQGWLRSLESDSLRQVKSGNRSTTEPSNAGKAEEGPSD